MTRVRAFGLTFALDLPLVELPATGDGAPDVGVTLVATRAELGGSGPCDPPREVLRRVDGLPLRYVRGRAGELRLDWGEGGADGRWLIDAAAGTVRCWAPAVPPAPAWQRVLLDSVLGTAALERGFEALHAGAVVAGGGALLIAAASGGGKTSLVAALVARGLPLLADDIVALGPDRPPLCQPGPPVMNVAAGSPAPGPPLARIGDEDWIAVPEIARVPAPPRAVVLLERRANAELRVERLQAGPLPLLPFALETGGAPARRARRFELLSDVAERADVLRLTAPLAGAQPDLLADRVLQLVPS